MMHRSSSETRTTVTTTVTTESSAVYMGGEGTPSATSAHPPVYPNPHQLPPRTPTVTSAIPANQSAPPPVQTPASTPREEPRATEAMIARGRKVLQRSADALTLTKQLRKERQAYLSKYVQSTKDEQKEGKEKVEDDHALTLANSPLVTLDRMREIIASRPTTELQALADSNLLKRCACILSDSGTRLGLGGSRRKDGRWGMPLNRKGDANEDLGSDTEEGGGGEEGIDLESFIIDYCSSVEIKLAIVQDELDEARAFNQYLESKVITEHTDVSNSDSD